jgi:hypothetical protein
MARSLLRDARYSRAGEHEHAGGSARLEQRSQLRPGADLQRAEQAVMSTDLLGAPDPAAEAA